MTDTPQPTEQASIGAALGRISSGIFILTTGAGPKATGMLASFIKQVSFHPPMVMAAVRQGRPILTRLRESGAFAINICQAKRQTRGALCQGFALDEPAFEGITHEPAVTGVPVLPDALAYLDASCGRKSRRRPYPVSG
ncbi:flavin reductase family protein [Chloracidobacterium sp. MS 40/45]|uniref:flavin reductase family protein n=1 Tax=Chloracidobacterium aggregatum TaxID=2851959 RepID=UPI001B8CA0EC|nr:flavin reductase family protein [Chloracidobacterium aggregatum]QUW00819.1 flavin reductase family protein [Chloracidobacterium sp. MS 40/45]